MQLEIHELDRRYASLRIDDPSRRSQLAASIGQHGQQAPVLVVRDTFAQTALPPLILVDGYQRVAALVELGRDLVDAVVIDGVSVADALVLRHRLSARRPTALEDGWLLVELIDSHHTTQETLGIVLNKSTSWVSRRLALVRELPVNAQDAVRDGLIPPHAAMKYLAPLARAKRSDCEKLVEGLAPPRVTTREVERLYLAWRRADPEGRARIVTFPRMFLKVDEALTSTPDVPIDEAAALVDELETVSGMCRRVRKRLRSGVLDRATGAERTTIASAWRETREAVGSLVARMTAEVLDDRVRHADGHPEPVASGEQRPVDRQGAEGVAEHGEEGVGERDGGSPDART